MNPKLEAPAPLFRRPAPPPPVIVKLKCNLVGVLAITATGSNGYYGLQASTQEPGAYGLFASSEDHNGNSQTAGFFSGNVEVTGNISKAGGSFKIDHLLDPENKYLSRSFVESPDMMNIYNGNVVTDRTGIAVVILPDYFSALNRDFRYQLTVIGQFAQAVIAEEIISNHFMFRSDKASVKVSSQVTGIRQDAWANAHPIPVEEDKPEKERGSYLHPDLYKQPHEKSVELARHPSAHKLTASTNQ